MDKKYVLGIDFGSDSVRALVAKADDGTPCATAVSEYRRWKQGLFCDSSLNQYRQHPQDYIDSLIECVKGALDQAGPAVTANMVGIGIDTTASTPVLTDRNGTPLALLDAYADNPDAMFVLWKDHTGLEEAERITAAAKAGPVDYTRYTGGSYSCESVWAKMLHCLTHSPSLQNDAWSWTEHCDWMVGLLTGNTRPETMPRSRCAAGHKALWNADWNGLPPMSFFKKIHPAAGLFEGHLFQDTLTCDQRAGFLCKTWADKLGLPEGISIAVGCVDGHSGAVGAGIAPGIQIKVLGTSTCDFQVADAQQMAGRAIPGISGQVDGSIIPGLIGFEAGQSAFGDIYAWFKRFTGRDLPALTAEAAQLPLTENDPVALDWLNGRRTPDGDPHCQGAIIGLTLCTTPAQLFKALVEATAFGSRAINERYAAEGFPVRETIAVGGISRKSPFVMQTLADVLGTPIHILDCDQACALGAAMFASVVAGIHPDTPTAQQAMKPGFSADYQPDPARKQIFDKLYQKYQSAGKMLFPAKSRDV